MTLSMRFSKLKLLCAIRLSMVLLYHYLVGLRTALQKFVSLPISDTRSTLRGLHFTQRAPCLMYSHPVCHTCGLTQWNVIHSIIYNIYQEYDNQPSKIYLQEEH